MPSDQLPLFPLELVLYPDEQRSLFIFEERYKDLVRDCRERDLPFGIVLTQDGKLKDIGCMARIVDVTREYEDGRSEIVVAGVQRFKVQRIRHERSYLTAEVEALVDASADLESTLKERVIAQQIKLLELAGRTPRPTAYQERAALSFFMAHNAGLTLLQKQDILEMDGESERISYLVDHLERFIPAVEEAEATRQKVRSNGHFKDFPPGGSPEASSDS